MKIIFLKYLIIVCFIFSFGCGVIRVPIQPYVGEISEIEKKLPLRAALLITNETKGYIFSGRPRGFAGSAFIYQFPLGEALEKASINIFSEIFEQVTVVRTLKDASQYKVVIKPTIEDFSFKYLWSFLSPRTSAKIKIHVSLFSENKKIWEKSIESEQIGEEPANFLDPTGSAVKACAKAANAAMVDVLKKVGIEIHQHAFIQKMAKQDELQISPEGLLEQLIRENPKSFVVKPLFGVYVIENDNNEVEIVKVVKGSSAADADIHVGDIIVSVDNVAIKNRYTLFKFYDRKNPGESFDVVLRRNGELIRKNITPKTQHFLKDAYALLYEIVKDKEPINLAIIVDSMNNVYLQGTALEQWKMGMKPYLLSTWENYYLQFFAPEKNFALIDREKVNNVLSEFKLQKSGLLSTESQQKIGKILGATHLLIIDYSRFYVSEKEALDIETHKLIELESGKILASVPLQIKIQL